MAFDISKNKRNRDLEEQGTWFEYGDGVSFLVARKNNQKYKGFISKKYRENERLVSSLSHTEQADKVSEKIMLEATAVYLLLGWKGVVDGGKEIKYSPGVAMKVLEDHDELRADIEAYAENRDNYLSERQAEDADNLKK
jgi:hypothetical protein